MKLSPRDIGIYITIVINLLFWTWFDALNFGSAKLNTKLLPPGFPPPLEWLSGYLLIYNMLVVIFATLLTIIWKDLRVLIYTLLLFMGGYEDFLWFILLGYPIPEKLPFGWWKDVPRLILFQIMALSILIILLLEKFAKKYMDIRELFHKLVKKPEKESA